MLLFPHRYVWIVFFFFQKRDVKQCGHAYSWLRLKNIVQRDRYYEREKKRIVGNGMPHRINKMQLGLFSRIDELNENNNKKDDDNDTCESGRERQRHRAYKH